MATAICSLEALSRWAVTGTPIQNRLADLATLLKFIRAHPYTDTRQFEADVSRLWKAGEDEEAVKRLKRLSACLILRRPKTIINLPPRRDQQCLVEFSQPERAAYDSMRNQTISKIDEALHNDSDVSRSGSYANILQQIESMRLFCNLGLRYESRHAASNAKGTSSSATSDSSWAAIAQRTFNAQCEMDVITCMKCESSLDLTETLLDGGGVAHRHTARFTRCLRFMCADCVHRKAPHGHTHVACGHSPSCPVAEVTLSGSSLEDIGEGMSLPKTPGTVGLSSKVEALVADLTTLPLDTKWFGSREPVAMLQKMLLTSLRQRCLLDMEIVSRPRRGRARQSPDIQRQIRWEGPSG